MEWDNGGFNPANFNDNSWDQPITSQTVTRDIATQSAAQDESGTGNVWGAWLRQIGTGVIGATLAQEVAKTNAQTRAQALQQPYYGAQASAAARPININTVLLFGAGFLAFMVLKK